MKRSEALAGLSRDHHGALFVAMKLRRADAATIGEALTSFEAYWERTGDHHFDEEERVLIGALPDDSPGWTDACARMVAEHVDLRARGAALPSLSGDEQLTAAHELGERLSDHVRFEERELFVMLEERLDDEALQALGEALDH